MIRLSIYWINWYASNCTVYISARPMECSRFWIDLWILSMLLVKVAWRYFLAFLFLMVSHDMLDICHVCLYQCPFKQPTSEENHFEAWLVKHSHLGWSMEKKRRTKRRGSFKPVVNGPDNSFNARSYACGQNLCQSQLLDFVNIESHNF